MSGTNGSVWGRAAIKNVTVKSKTSPRPRLVKIDCRQFLSGSSQDQVQIKPGPTKD